ncbi:MAG: hypothetical protein RL318_1722, partial [Fibrobacterota bacterium]
MEDDGDLAMNPTPSLAATSNSSLGDSMEIIMNPNRLLAGLSKRLRPFTLVSKAIAAFLLIATAMLAGLSGCSSDEQGHGLAAQNDSWVIAPRLLAENMDNEEFSTARWVRVQASRDGRVIAFEEVAYAKHSVTLTIPSAGDVKLSITGYNDSNRTMVMWSGTTDVPSGTASPVISVGKGPGLIPVPSPRFSLAAGTFKEAKKVALGVDSANLEIHYTLDGGDPSETSPVYRDSLLIEKTTTLRAIAWRKGRALSKIEEAHYVITLDTVVAPAFSLPAAKYRGWRKLSITSGTEGASIHYTTNGNEPNESSPKYSDSLEITSSMTIKAVALKKGMERSLVTTSSYTITLDTLKDPKFSPEGDRYTSAQDVVITSDSGATIHYTTDGSSPSVNSSRFEGSLRVEGSATIKAIAVRKGSVSSSIVTTKYTITPPGTLSAPEFDPVAGEYKTARNVAIRADSGVTIRYTLDNSAPTTSSPVYGGPILVSSSQVIKAIALKEGMTTSVPGVASYAIRPDTVDAPRFSLEPGTYEAGTTLAMLCDTTEASIHFTLDGSEPTGLSPKYLRPIALDTSVKVSAIALKDGLVKSEIARVDYVIRALGAVAAPVFDPPEAVYDTAKWVTIKSDTSNAVIYYTTNGSTPDSTSQRYTKPFVVAASQTIKAIAMKVGRPSSNVVSIEYAIREKGRVEAPQFTPNGGDFSAPASVEILSATDSAVIRYTVNGDEPTAASERYSKPLLISTSQVLRAIALKDGFTNSALSEAKFTIKPPDTVAMPTVSPEVKGFTGSGKVGIATATAGAKIYYTTNDSEPSDASMFYSDSIEILSSLTLKAIAMRDGMVPSKVATVKFTVTPLDTVAVPKFDIDSGSYAQAQVVSISSVTTGADIHYTTDGTQPTTASAKVSGSIKVDSSMT